MDGCLMEFNEVLCYLARRLASFERLFSPVIVPREPVKQPLRCNVEVIHIYYHRLDEEAPVVGYWEQLYCSLLEGFRLKKS